MKEKLTSTLGVLGFIIWFIITSVLAFMPLAFFNLPFWADFLIILSINAFPIVGTIINAVIWIWALVLCIRGPQDMFAIIYYILFSFNTLRIVFDMILSARKSKM